MEQISRRDFFSRRILGQIWQRTSDSLSVGLKAMQGQQELPDRCVGANPDVTGDERVVMPGYFSSPLYSYALLSEMPWEMLIEEAKKLGVAYEGRSKIDVVREIFLGTGGEEEAL